MGKSSAFKIFQQILETSRDLRVVENFSNNIHIISAMVIVYCLAIRIYIIYIHNSKTLVTRATAYTLEKEIYQYNVIKMIHNFFKG